MDTFGPYSPVYRAGDFYFISGQVGINAASKSAQPDIETQTSQALMNLRTLLEENNLQMNNVVKTTVFLTDMGDFTQMNEVYQSFFNGVRPARSTVAVKELPRLAKNKLIVEIEAIAFKKGTT